MANNPPRLNAGAREFVPSFNAAAPSFQPKFFAGPSQVVTLGAPAPKVPSPAPTTAANTPPAAPAPTAAAPGVVRESKSDGPIENWEERAAAKPSEVSTSAAAPAAAAASPAPASPAAAKKAAAATDAEPTEADLKKELKSIADASAEDDDEREHVNLIFLGHVDAGKSTISGHMLFLTGMVDKRTIEKYEREAKENNRGSWFYAYIMDTIEEERAKGKTVEVGRAHFATPKKRYTILDAPGHKNYVPNMIAGLAQADIGVLVVSAKTGEFESGFEKAGQTREHATLAKTLGIRQLIVAINKMDEPQIAWAQSRYDEIVGKIGTFLRQVGWAANQVVFLPISGYTGANLKDPLPPGTAPFYTGPSLVGLLDELKPIERNDTAPFRMPVVDKFKDLGFVYAMGKIEAGSVSKGQQLLLMPNKLPCKVNAIYHKEEDELKRAKAGESIRIALSGVEETDVLTGFVLCEAGAPVHVASEFVVQLAVLELPAANPLFTAGYEAVMHVHTCVKECTVVELLAEIDKKTKKAAKKKPTFVRSGALVNAKLVCSAPVCAELFESFPQLGRFTLRDKGRTVAIGKILHLGPGVPAPDAKDK